MSMKVTVTGAEIARLAGVERAAVSNWRRRYSDFPEPVGGSPANPLFDLDHVEDWLGRHGRGNPIAPLDRLWQEVRTYDEDADVSQTLAKVASFLSYRELSNKVDVAPQAPDQDRRQTNDRSRPSLWDRLADLARQHAEKDLFEELCSRFVESGTRTASVTTSELAAIIASLAPQASKGAVFDPACGIGTLLRALQRKTGPGAELIGQEIDPYLAAIADYRLGEGPPATIHVGDSFRDDKYPSRPGEAEAAAALVVCNPPHGVRDWGRDDLLHDPRWEFGLPPRSESELTWLQHCYSHTRPGGTLIIVMPVAAAARRSGRRIRTEILRKGVLREMIALPPGLTTARTLGVHLWVLVRPDHDHPCASKVRMIDASGYTKDELRKIESDGWLPFEHESNVIADVPVVELLGNDVDLTPSLYVQDIIYDLGEQYDSARAALPPVLVALRNALPEARNTLPTRLDSPMVSIGELDKTEALEVVLHREVPHTEIDVQAGDILVSAADPAESPRVVSDERKDAPTPDRHLIRCDPQILDPHFVAGFLHSDLNLRQSITGTGSYRFDVRRAMIPRMPLDEQQRYGAAFRQLAEFSELLRTAARLGDDVLRLARTGLTSGVFTPDPQD